MMIVPLCSNATSLGLCVDIGHGNDECVLLNDVIPMKPSLVWKGKPNGEADWQLSRGLSLDVGYWSMCLRVQHRFPIHMNQSTLPSLHTARPLHKGLAVAQLQLELRS
uniref:Uncharacterized protein n=1 Tax=Eutreptiella gymnastica TaxID=73025 RepID=A0A7S1IW62_9EUGL